MNNTKKSQNIYLYKGLQAEGIIEVRVKFICLASTTVKLGGGLTTKIHMVTASDRVSLTFSVSGGEKNDSLKGIKSYHQKVIDFINSET